MKKKKWTNVKKVNGGYRLPTVSGMSPETKRLDKRFGKNTPTFDIKVRMKSYNENEYELSVGLPFKEVNMYARDADHPDLPLDVSISVNFPMTKLKSERFLTDYDMKVFDENTLGLLNFFRTHLFGHFDLSSNMQTTLSNVEFSSDTRGSEKDYFWIYLCLLRDFVSDRNDPLMIQLKFMDIENSDRKFLHVAVCLSSEIVRTATDFAENTDVEVRHLIHDINIDVRKHPRTKINWTINGLRPRDVYENYLNSSELELDMIARRGFTEKYLYDEFRRLMRNTISDIRNNIEEIFEGIFSHQNDPNWDETSYGKRLIYMDIRLSNLYCFYTFSTKNPVDFESFEKNYKNQPFSLDDFLSRISILSQALEMPGKYNYSPFRLIIEKLKKQKKLRDKIIEQNHTLIQKQDSLKSIIARHKTTFDFYKDFFLPRYLECLQKQVSFDILEKFCLEIQKLFTSVHLKCVHTSPLDCWKLYCDYTIDLTKDNDDVLPHLLKHCKCRFCKQYTTLKKILPCDYFPMEINAEMFIMFSRDCKIDETVDAIKKWIATDLPQHEQNSELSTTNTDV